MYHAGDDYLSRRPREIKTGGRKRGRVTSSSAVEKVGS